MVSYILTGSTNVDRKDILNMLDKYLFINVDFRNTSLADYVQVGNLIELFTAIRDKAGCDNFFKRVAWVNVPEEAKAAIAAALEEIL